MPLVNVHMAAGRSPEQKRALMAAITDAMHEHIGAPRESVRVWINEFPSSDFMAGGELLADKQARIAANDAPSEDVRVDDWSARLPGS
jgi:4-oxalocrotonate tautomerase